ncbi:hypothetical protein GH714_032457 [Hevea brasiliensis]|uniref:Uncharacterized protein n=1 Tax=Hevea brasiliensis TaxID=3981 RepID=A0A6A6N9V8_HEVBR|nr:hypothetical protein GH714_032457 [Hevea brasiliensis]
MQFPDAQSPIAVSGLLAPAAEYSGGSSKKVNELRTSNGKRSLPQQNGETHASLTLVVKGLDLLSPKGKYQGLLAHLKFNKVIVLSIVKEAVHIHQEEEPR